MLLVLPVTAKEVFNDLQDISDLKALGRDGLNVVFYAWPVVGKDVTNVVLQFFIIGKMHASIN